MKKYLIYAGMFLGSFLVINVGMYFLLSMTQPEVSHELNAAADSTTVHADSLSIAADSLIHEDLTHTVSDSTADQETDPVADHSTAQEKEVAEAGEAESIPVQEDTEIKLAVNEDTTDNQTAEVTEDLTASVPEPTEAIQTEIAVQEEPEPVLAPNPKEIAKLAKLLEGMKPAEAAAIASRLDVEEIVMLVMKMKDRKAAKMMAELPISTAARVAQRMSELVEQEGIKS